ncbi:tRNA preQ1(34) S-adenosylmethionine ribosyltransferase-isomerase QueA [bacterium]|nr:tRNA preQ1(34) S-adenosylmethionine ribosyltransferase-isomerase QueA [bacterium]
MKNKFDIENYDYYLPKELIAQEAAEPRDSARLLHLMKTGEFEDKIFRDITGLLRSDDLLVVNNTKVFPARLLGNKVTGGRAEIFLLDCLGNNRWTALVKPARRLKIGTVVKISEELTAEIIEVNSDASRVVKLHYDGDIWKALERFGHTPLPLYIERSDRIDDAERYQTVYANEIGAVAAPTAGLHFNNDIIENIISRGVELAKVTLHVGWGTFSSIEAKDIRAHTMHSEFYEISSNTADMLNTARTEGRRIVAVGTTTVRALESAAVYGFPLKPISEKTQLFIFPGFKFKVVSAIVTNFHIPKSSLLVMISAFTGRDVIMDAYKHAIAQKYRFYSYGDAMFIE